MEKLFIILDDIIDDILMFFMEESVTKGLLCLGDRLFCFDLELPKDY